MKEKDFKTRMSAINTIVRDIRKKGHKTIASCCFQMECTDVYQFTRSTVPLILDTYSDIKRLGNELVYSPIEDPAQQQKQAKAPIQVGSQGGQ